MFTREQLQGYINDGGVTLHVDGMPISFDSGYQVAQRDGEEVINVQDVDAIYTAICNRLDYLDMVDWFGNVGLWIDDDKAYIDISYHIKDEEDAIRIGIREKQLSIWDWNTNACMYL